MSGTMISPIERFPSQKLARENGPLFQQLVELVRGLIARGALEVGSELPKEAEIEARLGVSLITVRRALRELEDLGLIQKRSAKPALVTAKSPSVRAGTRFASTEDLVNFTDGAELVVTSYAAEASPVVEKHFGLAPGEPGWCLHGYLAVGGQPKTFVTTYFPPDIGTQMKVDDFSDVLIFKNLIRCLGLRIQRVLVTARSELASHAHARVLGVKPGSAMMTTEMVYLTDRQRPVEVTISSNSSDHFVLSYDIALSDD